MNGDAARQAERDRALAGVPGAQDRFRRLSKAMTELAQTGQLSVGWEEFGRRVGANRNGLGSWKTYLNMARQWSIFPIPEHTCTADGIILKASKSETGNSDDKLPILAVTSQSVVAPTLPEVATSPANEKDTKSSFKQVEVFPLIYRLVTERTFHDGPFVTHTDLVKALQEDTEGRELVLATMTKNKHGFDWTASNMLAWFSQRFTIGKNQYEAFLDREKIGSTWAYRSRQTWRTSAVPPDLDEVFAMEGAPQLVLHLKRERDAGMVKAKLKAVEATTGCLACECCGFEAKYVFPNLSAPIVEVHHRAPLGTSAGVSKVTLKDLAILCPNCHRGIHRSGGVSVEDFRARYFADKA